MATSKEKTKSKHKGRRREHPVMHSSDTDFCAPTLQCACMDGQTVLGRTKDKTFQSPQPVGNEISGSASYGNDYTAYELVWRKAHKSSVSAE